MRVNKNLIFGLVMMFVLGAVQTLFTHKTPSLLDYLILFLISYPWRTKCGNVVSLWGGYSEGKIFSVFSVFQSARGDANSLFGICLYQRGKDVEQTLGFNVIQWADKEAEHYCGFVLIQRGEYVGKHGLSISALVIEVPIPGRTLASGGGMK